MKEFLVITVKGAPTQDEHVLNKYGRAGWLMTAALCDPTHGRVLYMERERQN